MKKILSILAISLYLTISSFAQKGHELIVGVSGAITSVWIMNQNFYGEPELNYAPKSGYAANSEAKVCAAAVVARLQGKDDPVPSYVNTCYSLITPSDGMSVAMVYRLGDKGKIIKIKGSGGLSPMGADDFFHKQEALFADGWYRSISNDIWG